MNTKKLARAGIIASLYVILSLITFPVASGAIQFRLSEALCVLPLIFIEAVPALFIGCALSNLITGCAIFDIIFGSIITLVASVATYAVGRIIKNTPLKIIAGGIFPVTLNAFLLPLIWIWCYGALEYMYILQATFLVVSQSVSIYALGTPLYLSTVKLKDKGLRFFA
ncbi:MAG: QueT transporter family protein [Clostridia bacterium]|nr:QueT transporter family protein [Clostridia bacterium]